MTQIFIKAGANFDIVEPYIITKHYFNREILITICEKDLLYLKLTTDFQFSYTRRKSGHG